MHRRPCTQHDPDEYWQAPEVAHRLVFGYGALTWEWCYGLRGYSHVLPFAVSFQLLRSLSMDAPTVVAYVPRLVQAVALAVGDACLGQLTERHVHHGAGRAAVLCSVTSWFVGYCGVRPYSSSMEASLLSAALAVLPPPASWQRDSWRRDSEGELEARGWRRHSLVGSAMLAALALNVRPTAALILVPLSIAYALAVIAAHHRPPATPGVPAALHGSAGRWWGLGGIGACVAATLCAALLVLCGGGLLDRACTGSWSLPALTFLHFNLRTGGASYYGTHPWHWYATAALPATLGLHALLVAGGLVHTSRASRCTAAGCWACAPAAAALACALALSLSAHKELRFMLPIVHPLLLPYAGVALAALTSRRRRRVLFALALANGLALLYLSVGHQRCAPVNVRPCERAPL